MNLAGEIITGAQRAWTLIEKLGEGDAGEVYRVESLLESKPAILKRPRRSAFASDILRQAAQIETEGKILRALNGLNLPLEHEKSGAGACAAIPKLLDQSKTGAEFTDRFFIILETAQGIDLTAMARILHARQAGEEGSGQNRSAGELRFLGQLAEQGEFPWLVLLRALTALLQVFRQIHALQTTLSGDEQSFGLLWNDVKPEHLFWDIHALRLTLVDWGNGKFLEPDGTTKDRRFSRADDYSQFLHALGKFLEQQAPDLHAKLAWPAEIPSGKPAETVASLEKRVTRLHRQELDGLNEVRQRERDLLLAPTPKARQFDQLERAHGRILEYGELPDYPGAEKFALRLAGQLVAAGELVEFSRLCERASRLPDADAEKWLLLGSIAAASRQAPEPAQATFGRALLAGLEKDWPVALWEILSVNQAGEQSPETSALTERLRRMQPEIGALSPFVIVNRLAHTLQAEALKQEDLVRQDGSVGDQAGIRLESLNSAIRFMKNEILANWRHPEPDPPYGGLEYSDIDRLVGEIEPELPETRQTMLAALDQPKAQVEIVLEAWRRKDLETARRGLRRMLFWDPDRLRVFHAEQAILATPDWLEAVRRGPRRSEQLAELVARLELDGRELRNRIGPARWLDLLLETFQQLRKGGRPSELLMDHPELLNDMPWLEAFTPRKPQSAPSGRPVMLERQGAASPMERLVKGRQAGRFGLQEELSLAEPLDAWAPEAPGSSARVFSAILRSAEGKAREVALKLARGNRLEYALPLFREEVKILALVHDIPGVTRLLECGFLQLDADQSLPPEDPSGDARQLSGAAERYGMDELHAFLNDLERKAHQGWLPYLALEKRSNGANLIQLCDAGYTRGRFLPVKESLRLAIQICDILQAAHARNVVYRDHKIVHYYWQPEDNGVYVIDWNVSQLHPQGLSPAEIQFDLVQLAARGLHHILTGRPAPGALPASATSPEQIEAAARSYSVAWTFDDERLSRGLREILERALSAGYTSAASLRADLLASFEYLPDNGY